MFHQNRPLPNGDQWLTKRLQALGYRGAEDGMCEGQAFMGGQASLCDELDTYYKRLQFIRSLKVEEINSVVEYYNTKITEFTRNSKHNYLSIYNKKEEYKKLSQEDKKNVNELIKQCKIIARNKLWMTLNALGMDEETKKKEFEKRIKDATRNLFIQEVVNNDLDTLPEDYQLARQIHAYFTGLELYFHGYKYNHLIEKEKKKLYQNPQLAMSLLPSIELERLGGIVEKEQNFLGDFSGVYSQEDLTQYFESLQKTLETLVLQQPLCLILRSSDHTIAVSFDPKQEDKWVVINNYKLELIGTYLRNNRLISGIESSTESSQKIVFSNSTMIASQVFSAFQVKNNKKDYVIFSTKIYSTPLPSEIDLEVILNQWQQETGYQNIHNMTEEKAKFTDVNNATWLSIECRSGNIDNVKKLLSINDKDILNLKSVNFEQTPLFDVIEMGHDELFDLLLENGARVDIVDILKFTPLHQACLAGKIEMVAKLLEKDISQINCVDNYNETPLHQAVRSGQFDLVALLLQKGSKVDLLNSDGNAPLHFAAIIGDFKIFEILLKSNNNIFDQDLLALFHRAAFKGNLEIIKKLLEMNPQLVDMQAADGKTALIVATENNQENIVEFLLSKNANTHLHGTNGYTPLHVAAITGSFNLFQKFLTSENINLPCNGNNTSLHLAAGHGHLAIVDFLLKNNADYNATNNLESLALDCSLKSGNLNIFEKLFNLEKINYDEKDFITFCEDLLIHAAYNGHASIIKFILLELENLNIVLDLNQVMNKKNNKNILLIAAQGGHLDLLCYLLSLGLDVNSADIDGETALHIATKKNYVFMTEILLNEKAEVNAQNAKGNTPLHLAAYSGHLDIVDELLDNGAQINILNRYGKTPLDCAIMGQKSNVVHYLKSKGAITIRTVTQELTNMINHHIANNLQLKDEEKAAWQNLIVKITDTANQHQNIHDILKNWKKETSANDGIMNKTRLNLANPSKNPKKVKLDPILFPNNNKLFLKKIYDEFNNKKPSEINIVQSTTSFSIKK